MLRRLLFASALALAACGQPASTGGATTATTAALTPAEITTAVAALPAPYNAGDYDAGRRIFVQCGSCHTIDTSNANRMGPHLHGVIGRHIASVEGFAYSPAMKAQTFTWDAAQLDQYLKSPQALVPGNRMAFAGLRNDTQRRDLVTYLAVESGR